MSKPRITVDLSGIEAKLSPEAMRAKQAVFAQRVGSDMNERCPVDEGTLRDSMPENSDFEKGQIVWNTPYAKRVLNADGVRTVKNPRACPQWPEAVKAERLGEWQKMAGALVAGATGSVGGAG
jgi:hypothetical protein|nr:MAG TPA: Minor capsid protein [Caudoviricetes sp.]